MIKRNLECREDDYNDGQYVGLVDEITLHLILQITFRNMLFLGLSALHF